LTVVVDFDGTITVEDTLVMVISEFGDWQVFQEAAAALDRGEITLHEEIRRDCEPITAPLEEVVPWLVEHAEVRPGFRELAFARRPLIVSSNFHELIEPLLRREGVELEVRANRLDPRPDGWRTIFRNAESCDTCGEPCKRSDLPAGEVVYVGDGYSDRCAALAADRVFARDGLAAYLAKQGTTFEPFDDFRDVVAALPVPSPR
jgi:2-hydroxy-3-keto-5-methylthiopentenyl-1-phosphate phosphatase